MYDNWQNCLEKIDDYRWYLPKTSNMRVGGLIYASETMIKQIQKDQATKQVANAAALPGIVKYSLAMPDIHWGYGLPIGGVVATDPEEDGVVSPGGIGFDINCGVRLLRSNLKEKDVKEKIIDLTNALFNNIPCGVGSGGKIFAKGNELNKILINGAKWAVDKGYGKEEDLEYCEENGAIKDANPDKVSERAKKRGYDQTGTLGSGNHFLEIQVVDTIFDTSIANIFGIKLGQVVIMIHSGSRGLGYQVCDDYYRNIMIKASEKYNIKLFDKQLACAPVNSPEGQDYLSAMRCAANYAWANRQCLTYLTRKVFEKFFNMKSHDLELDLVYDVAHNIGKFETYNIGGKQKRLCVHRKGATRAFPPGHNDIPLKYRKAGQPVIIPGDMETYSYLLSGTQKAMDETFGTNCHGAGRCLSRTAAIKATRGKKIDVELEKKGIIVRAHGKYTLSEEDTCAYKDINEVIDVVVGAGLSKKVCRMHPIGVVKG